ncbi:hypothetical protein PQR02_04780 [Paraburkholderia sediminicola]|uniref:Uncharacterized protein n=1 Tax=Paraburkholderia rhynchosiae TaxID=487049 RepID=A0ACC7N961_9BURK
MTHITRKKSEELSKSSNVISLQTDTEINRIRRQASIRKHLLSLAEREARNSAIASASALLKPDGTIQLTACGIEPDVADQIADALQQLTDAVRAHGAPPTTARRGQRGVIGITLALMIGFMAADFFNQIAWLDAVLMLAAQLIAAALASRSARDSTIL